LTPIYEEIKKIAAPSPESTDLLAMSENLLSDDED
jgi:hypothetical protein